MSQAAQAVDAARRFAETSLQRTMTAAQALVRGQGSRDDVLLLDAHLLGAVGVLAIVAPGPIAAVTGAGLSPSSFACASTRAFGVALVALAYLASSTSMATGASLSRALLLFWTLEAGHLLHLVTGSSELTSLIHYLLLVISSVMALAHAVAARLITF